MAPPKAPQNQAVFLIVDLLFSSSLLITITLLYFVAIPPHRGFYCADDSIKYPYIPPLLHEVATVACLLGIPIAIFAIIEIVTSEGHEPLFRNIKISHGVLRWFEVTSTFLFGAGVSEVTCDSAKYIVGRLRPNFLDLCRPNPGCDTLAIASNKYIVDYVCEGTDKELILDARLSFPSNFAAFAFYSAFYVAIYLQYNYKWNKAKTVRHLMQLALVMTAWFMALSRFVDHSAHWGDVAAGIGIGTTSAVLVAVFVSDLHEKSKVRQQLQLDVVSDEIISQKA